MHRRTLLAAGLCCLLAVPPGVRSEGSPPDAESAETPRVAAVVTAYYRNSHADMLVTRLLESYTLDGQGERPKLELASLYTDQVPENDISRELAEKHGFSIHETVAGALTAGTDDLAVDGVLLVAEHGDYPKSETGQTVYPKRRLFSEVVEVFRASGRVVPVFIDKHLADNWKDAKWIYDTAREMGIPLMAGSSLPVLWRQPPIDVRRGAGLDEMAATSYGGLDSYGFHALEMVQSLAERRRGGETGIRSVRCLTGEAVWKAGREGVYSRDLLEAALSRLQRRPVPRGDRRIEKLAREPVLFVINYADGLRASVFTLKPAVAEWAVAWRRRADGQVRSTLFRPQDERPYNHFTYLLQGIETMLHTGEPAWPVERTLLTSGALHALLTSKQRGGAEVKTPYLRVRYSTDWSWQQPPPPPAPTGRK